MCVYLSYTPTFVDTCTTDMKNATSPWVSCCFTSNVPNASVKHLFEGKCAKYRYRRWEKP